MAFCPNCGTSVEAGVKFCPSCGSKQEAPAASAAATVPPAAAVPPAAPVPPVQTKLENAFNQFNNTADNSAAYTPEEITGGKGMSVLAYLGILVLIPLFAVKDNRFVRFHTNQGLVLCIVEILWNIVYRIVRWILPYGFLYRLVGFIGTIVSLLFFVLLILGIVNACQGKAKELPIIGQFRLLK